MKPKRNQPKNTLEPHEKCGLVPSIPHGSSRVQTHTFKYYHELGHMYKWTPAYGRHLVRVQESNPFACGAFYACRQLCDGLWAGNLLEICRSGQLHVTVWAFNHEEFCNMGAGMPGSERHPLLHLMSEANYVADCGGPFC